MIVSFACSLVAVLPVPIAQTGMTTIFTSARVLDAIFEPTSFEPF